MTAITTGGPQPAVGSGSSLAQAFGPHDPNGRHWWWIFITLTFGLLCAHLVAEGFSYALIALVVLTALMSHPISMLIVNLRGWYLVLGIYFAILLICCLELYLGTVGVHYGPIGTPDRPWPTVDTFIIDGLLCLYRFSDLEKALLSTGLSVALYLVFVTFLSNTAVTAWGHRVAAIGIFVSVFFWLPFTESMESKHIAFSKAAASVSGAKKALGSYKERIDSLNKEISTLDELIKVLSDSSQPDRAKLVALMHKYAELIKRAREEGANHDSATRQKRDPLVYLEPLRPTIRYETPPSTPVFTPPVTGTANDPSLTAFDVINQQVRIKEAEEAFASGQATKRQRDQLLVTLRALIGDEVDKAFQGDRSQVVSDEAILGIVQTVAARSAADAMAELERRIAALEAELKRREDRDEALRKNVDDYAKSRIENARNANACARIIADLRDYFGSDDGKDLIVRVRVNGERAREFLNPQLLPGTELARPPALDREINQPAVDQEVQRLMDDQNISQPEHNWTELREFLNTVGDSASGPITNFAESACRRGQSSIEIRARLDNMRIALPLNPTPRSPG